MVVILALIIKILAIIALVMMMMMMMRIGTCGLATCSGPITSATYNAKTKEMKKKLEQNDRDIRNIMNDLKTEKEVYAKALFLVFRDHGMTDEGDHGGSSEG